MSLHNKDIHNQILPERLQHIWRVALYRNNFRAVGRMIDVYDISASTEVSPFAMQPIPYVINRGHLHDPSAATTIQVLIAKGAELSERDKFGAVPADHALVSDNADVAHMLVLETVRHNLTMKHPIPYKPQVEGIIYTTMCHAERARKIDNLRRNLGIVIERLWDSARSRHEETAMAANTALACFENLSFTRPLEMFVKSRPNGTLQEAFQRYKYIQRSPDAKESLIDLARQGQVVSHEQWRVANEL